MRDSTAPGPWLLLGLLLLGAGCGGGGDSAATEDCYAACDQADVAACGGGTLPVDQCQFACDEALDNEPSACLEPLADVYACQAEYGFTCNAAGATSPECTVELQLLADCRQAVANEELPPEDIPPDEPIPDPQG